MFQEKLKKFEEILDIYENKIGLDKLIYNENVDKILLMDESHLSNLSKLDCEEYSYILAQYTAVLNKELSRNKIREYWATNELDKLIAKYHEKYLGQYMKYEIMKATIITQDSAAQVLNQIILHAKSRVIQLEEVIKDLQMMSKILSNIARSKCQ